MSYWKVIDYVGLLPCLALMAMCVRKLFLISGDISIHFDIRLLGISLSWSITMNQQCPGLILYTTVSVCNRYHHSFRTLNVSFQGVKYLKPEGQSPMLQMFKGGPYHSSKLGVLYYSDYILWCMIYLTSWRWFQLQRPIDYRICCWKISK